ncbi:hypothetical protein V6N11_001695 [Hibiscus sabdariffa]|uniref:Uncharacterized protein n=2 Tax=Hibiscus sabdariffa TaxID=183260 RepID=A0ABR2G575_9ROSI
MCTDNWIPALGPLRHMFLPQAPAANHLDFLDFVLAGSHWDYVKQASFFTNDIVSHIADILPHSIDGGHDFVAWKGANFGVFSLASAYDLLLSDSWNAVDSKWRHIWSVPVPQRIRVFLL